MGSTIIESDFPHDIINRGNKDAIRHNKRVNKAVRDQLKDIISSQDIITSEGNKKVKVRLKYLDQYHFRHNSDRKDSVGRDEFDDLEEGEVLSKPSDSEGKGGRPVKPGDEAGEELYEAEFTIEELTDMMIEELELPNLDETIKNEITSEVLDYTDRRKRVGIEACLDKKQTLLAYIKRKAQSKNKNIIFDRDDLRYKTWEISHEKNSNAVIWLMIDRSGSMWEEKIYTIKALYFWIVQFLRRKYDKVEIKFIAHDYYAKELSEKDFFSVSDSGGTRVSSAYELCYDLIKHNYPSDKWNIYCFHSSDGDSWGDEATCSKLVAKIVNELGAKLFAYTEINIDNYKNNSSDLYNVLESLANDLDEVLVSTIENTEDIISVLSYFLKSTRVLSNA